MLEEEWEKLLAVIRGERLSPLPTGFIIDSPWLPNWAGHTILDYFGSEDVWLAANMRALETFPDTWFLPGFWSEYGMCTEPSAFGAVSVWEQNEFPFARRVLRTIEDIDHLEAPDPKKHGLLPFVIQRLRRCESRIAATGRKIRFAVARGPLNIASFLLGTTEFLTALKVDPQRTHHLLELITGFLTAWIAHQREAFPSIDGILLLDDIVGFISEKDFLTFAQPYLARAFAADVSVRFFHNDAPCKACAPHLASIGINLLNFGIQHSITEMRKWTGGQVTLLGNVPPRDVLAQGSPEGVAQAVREQLAATSVRTRLIVSCGGGMPPGAPTANVRALVAATRELT